MALSERRIKRSPLRNVACLVRSFPYAPYAGLHRHVERGSIPHENLPKFESWVRHWNLWVSMAFLRAYLHSLSAIDLLPREEGELCAMLRGYLLPRCAGSLWTPGCEGALVEISLEVLVNWRMMPINDTFAGLNIWRTSRKTEFRSNVHDCQASTPGGIVHMMPLCTLRLRSESETPRLERQAFQDAGSL